MVVIYNPRPLWLRIVREIFFSVKNPLTRLYYRMAKPEVPGVKTFVMRDDRILLVQLGRYAGLQWVLPGGKIDRGESAAEAAVREVKEEAGLVITAPVIVAERNYTNEYKRVTVKYFYTETNHEDITIDCQEIVNAGWFTLDALPEPIQPRLREELAMLEAWHRKS